MRDRVNGAALRTAGGSAPVGCIGGRWAPGELPVVGGAAKGPTLFGGVGYRWQCDASFGVCASDWLATQLPPGARSLDLGYGAIYAAQDLRELLPTFTRLVLIAGVHRGRSPGGLYRYRWAPVHPDPEELQERIREAGAGVVHPDHLLLISEHFAALPEQVEVWELEPVEDGPGDRLSGPARARLAELGAALLAGDAPREVADA